MNKKMEKFASMSSDNLNKEISNLQIALMQQKIDIANYKTKGIHRISQIKKDIARINTILSQRRGEKND